MLARTLKFVVISSLKNTINFSLVRTEIAPFDEVKGGTDKAWQFIGSRLRRVYLAGNPALLFRLPKSRETTFRAEFKSITVVI